MRPNIIVMAKEPIPGRVKTRLTPPLSPVDAARLAHASLGDTIAAARAVDWAHPVLSIEGSVPECIGSIDATPQRGEGLGQRIANAFDDVPGPSLLIGMDCPQTTPNHLEYGLDVLSSRGIDAVVGPASDGGYWAIGLRSPDPNIFDAVPMSSSCTFAAQMNRLEDLGLRVELLPELRDVDTFTDAIAIAELAPNSRFARAFRAIETRLPVG
jgi:rSAM/selenodomain-associated transferase 1